MRYSDNESLTFGVPFADGVLPAGASVRAVTGNGRDIPIQTDCMTTWHKDLRFVKWLLVDMQADAAGDGETAWLEYAPADGPAPEAKSRITTTETDGVLTIDTGAMRLLLRTNFDLWRHRESNSVFAGCQVKAADGWRDVLHGAGVLLYMKDQHGNHYDSLGVSPAPQVTIEEQGPLRVCVRIDGHLTSTQGIRFCPYRLRIHLYAGKTDLRIFHTFVFDQDPTRVELAAIGMRVLAHPGDRARAAVGAEGADAHGSDNWRTLSLLQSDDRHYESRLDDMPFGAGKRSPGWAALGGSDAGLVAVIRDGWQEYPKGFRLGGDELDVQIWPEGHAQPLSFLTPFREPAIRFSDKPDEAEIKRVLAEHPTAPLHLRSSGSLEDIRWVEDMVERHAPDRAKSYVNTGTDNGIGAAKTTEVLLRFAASPIENDAAAAFAATVQEPLTAVVDPVYLCGTEALGHFLPAGDSRFKNADAFLDDGHFEFCVSDPVERSRLYGMMRFGNLICLHGGVPDKVYQLYKDSEPEKALRYFGPFNNEACDQILAVWAYFFRTGNPRYLRFAQLASRATADVGFVHAYPNDPDRVGVMHYHNAHQWSGVLCRSHSIVGGIMADYYLTGNRRLLDVALEAADQVVRVQNPAGILNCFYGCEMVREFTGPLSILIEAYQSTWQERYGALAERSLCWLLRTVRTPGRMPQSVFTVGPRGDEAIVYADGYPEIHFGNAYDVYAVALRLFPSKELKSFLVAKADYWIWQYPRGGGISAVVGLAYDITGNSDYAACLMDSISGLAPADPATRSNEIRHFGTYNCSLGLSRLMKTVALAMDQDPEGFAEHVKDWRERRDKLPDRTLDPRPFQAGETHLGRIGTEPFRRLDGKADTHPQRNDDRNDKEPS